MMAASSDRPMVRDQYLNLFFVKATKVLAVEPGMLGIVWPFRFSLLP